MSRIQHITLRPVRPDATEQCPVLGCSPIGIRSIAGGYDNESIAVSAICFTFYLWCRSLRSEKSWPIAILAGISYIYMVAAWGGYIFVINMIGVHAAALIPLRSVGDGAGAGMEMGRWIGGG